MKNKTSQNPFVAFSEASKATKHQIFNGPLQVRYSNNFLFGHKI